jgi:hypothetical protein
VQEEWENRIEDWCNASGDNHSNWERNIQGKPAVASSENQEHADEASKGDRYLSSSFE